MASWNVERLLDHVQEILGEPVGGFYNITTRLDQMNQAQRELAEETRAMTNSASISVTLGTSTYNIPTDFLTFDREAPTFTDSAGNRNPVRVVDVGLLDRRFPNWQDASLNTGTPEYLFLRNGQVTLYPTPATAGTLTLPYVQEPTALAALSDVPFNGLQRLNRFAPALAYRVAYVNMIGRAPQVAAMFQDLYERQERLMRHHTRSNPQLHPALRPATED